MTHCTKHKMENDGDIVRSCEECGEVELQPKFKLELNKK